MALSGMVHGGSNMMDAVTCVQYAARTGHSARHAASVAAALSARHARQPTSVAHSHSVLSAHARAVLFRCGCEREGRPTSCCASAAASKQTALIALMSTVHDEGTRPHDWLSTDGSHRWLAPMCKLTAPMCKLTAPMCKLNTDVCSQHRRVQAKLTAPTCAS
jgi:hypothetical protein